MWPALLLLLAPPQVPPLQVRLEAGMTALQKNDLPAAQKNFEQAVRLAPTNAGAWFLLSQAHARQNKMTDALAAANRSLQFAGKDAAILHNLAVFFRQANQPDRSITAAKRALTLENSAEMHTLLGQIYMEKQDWKNATAELAEARRLSPYSEDAIFNLAQAYLRAQDFPGAIAVIEDGRKTFDKSPQLELAMGVAYYGQRRFTDAVDRFLHVIRLDPEIPQPYYFLSRILEHAANRLPEVVERATTFERLQPQSPLGFLLHAKALVLFSPDQPEQARALLDKALSLKEDLAETHYLLGLLLERKGDYAGAAKSLERSIAINDKDPQPHFRLARVYDRLGRKQEAAAQRALHEKLSNEEGKSTVR